MLVHGVKGGLGPKLQGSHGTGQHPQHCQHHPQDADDAGEWGDHTIGGGGGVRGPGTGTYMYTHGSHKHMCGGRAGLKASETVCWSYSIRLLEVVLIRYQLTNLNIRRFICIHVYMYMYICMQHAGPPPPTA